MSRHKALNAEFGTVLETERLILRPHVDSDVEGLQLVLGDPIAMEFYPAPLDRQGVQGWIRKNQERCASDGFGKWAAVLKSTGEVAGSCGLVLQEVEGRNQIEVGYNIRRDLWGKGYATEAARAWIDYGFRQLGAERIIAMIRPPNLRSIRVAEKNGMVCEKVIMWRDYEHCIYAKTRAEA